MKKGFLILGVLLIGFGSFLQNKYSILYKYNIISARVNLKNGNCQLLLFTKHKAIDEYNEVGRRYDLKYVVVDTFGMRSWRWNGVRDYNTQMMKSIDENDIPIQSIEQEVDSLFKMRNYELAKRKLLEIPEVIEFAKYLDSMSGGKDNPAVMLWTDDLGQHPNGFVGHTTEDGGIIPVFKYVVDFYNLDNIKPTAVQY